MEIELNSKSSWVQFRNECIATEITSFSEFIRRSVPVAMIHVPNESLLYLPQHEQFLDSGIRKE